MKLIELYRTIIIYIVIINPVLSTHQITCGSLLKLEHIKTKFKLHSHEIPYGSGSGQQSVTGFPEGNDANSYWVIKGTKEKPCLQGSLIGKKQRIRLQHKNTMAWLHSHHHRSPITKNQEVSCFGNPGMSDDGDEWIIEWDSKAKTWSKDLNVRLKHVSTNMYLASLDRKYGHPIPGQTEICAIKNKDKNTLWQAAEGVYFKKQVVDINQKDEL